LGEGADKVAQDVVDAAKQAHGEALVKMKAISLPLVFLKGVSFSVFFQLAKTNPVVRFNLIASGLWFYGYNELASMTIKKTSAVIEFVANTTKHVIVIMGVAIVMGESLNPSSSPAEPAALVVYSSTPSSKILLARKIRFSQRQLKLIGRKRACCG